MTEIGDAERDLLKEYPNFTIIGIDEVGKGAWAGPVTVAAIAIQSVTPMRALGVNDSKKLSPTKRETLYPLIKDKAIAWSVQHGDLGRIDLHGIEEANTWAMQQAFQSIARNAQGPLIAVVDGNPIGRLLPNAHKTIFLHKGDSKCVSIAAASILAKVVRDRLMALHSTIYPEYGFDQHKGYGTKQHQDALDRFGVCGIHRRTYRPIKRAIREPAPLRLSKPQSALGELLGAPDILSAVSDSKELSQALLDTKGRLLIDGSYSNAVGIELMKIRRILAESPY